MNKIIGLFIAIFIFGSIISGCDESAAPEGATPDLAGLPGPVPVPEPAPAPEPDVVAPLVCGDDELLIDNACQKCDGEIVDGECKETGMSAIGTAIVEAAQKCMLNPKPSDCLIMGSKPKVGELEFKKPSYTPPSYLPTPNPEFDADSYTF